MFLGVKAIKGVRVIYSAISVRPCAIFCANGNKVLLPVHQKTNQPEQTLSPFRLIYFLYQKENA